MPPSETARLAEDIDSGDPVRVLAALRVLDDAWKRLRRGELSFPEPTCLDAFGGDVPDEALERYLSVIENYPDFEPIEPSGKIWHSMVEAVIRYGRGRKTFDVVLSLRVDSYPPAAVREALKHIRYMNPSDPQEIQAAREIIEFLLDSDVSREVTVSVLGHWAGLDDCPEIIEGVWHLLKEAEKAELEAARAYGNAQK